MSYEEEKGLEFERHDPQQPAPPRKRDADDNLPEYEVAAVPPVAPSTLRATAEIGPRPDAMYGNTFLTCVHCKRESMFDSREVITIAQAAMDATPVAQPTTLVGHSHFRQTDTQEMSGQLAEPSASPTGLLGDSAEAKFCEYEIYVCGGDTEKLQQLNRLYLAARTERDQKRDAVLGNWSLVAAENIFALVKNASYFSTRNAEHRQQMLAGWAEIIRTAYERAKELTK